MHKDSLIHNVLGIQVIELAQAGEREPARPKQSNLTAIGRVTTR